MLSRDQWSLTLFAKNVFDKYAETSASDTKAYVQTVTTQTAIRSMSVLIGTTCCRRGWSACVLPGKWRTNRRLEGGSALKTGFRPNPDILLRHSIDENRNGDQAEDPVFPGSTQTDRKGRRRVLKSGKKIQRIPSGVSGQDGLGNRKQLVLGPSSKAKK